MQDKSNADVEGIIPDTLSHGGGAGKSEGLSSQQRRYSGKSGLGAFAAYRELVSGNSSLASWVGFELYDLILAGISGVIGYSLRRFTIGAFLRESGGKLTIGKGVTFRQPNRISLGRGVIVDDFALLDYRSCAEDASRSSDSSESQSSAARDSESASPNGIVVEDHVLIGRNSLLVCKGGTLRLRRGSNISSFCRIATQSSVDIGEGVLVAAYAYIGPGNHQLDDLSRPIIEQPMEIRGGVVIGSGAWIGAHAIVVDGVKIGKNAVVGANSLVLSDVPEGAIVAGSPAKIVRYRSGSPA